MSYPDTLSTLIYDLNANSQFSYTCQGCGRCCHDKTIRLSPYEVLRLARNRGMTTTDFIKHHTEAGGTVLKFRDDDRGCAFLSGAGCSVHADRPLACRLYPLARWTDPDGKESYGRLTPHPQTSGIYGQSGTVMSYLSGQGVTKFYEVGDRYGQLYDRMIAAISAAVPDELDRRAERRGEIDELGAGDVGSIWFDIDRTVTAYCHAKKLPVPFETDKLVHFHVLAVLDWLGSEAEFPIPRETDDRAHRATFGEARRSKRTDSLRNR